MLVPFVSSLCRAFNSLWFAFGKVSGRFTDIFDGRCQLPEFFWRKTLNQKRDAIKHFRLNLNFFYGIKEFSQYLYDHYVYILLDESSACVLQRYSKNIFHYAFLLPKKLRTTFFIAQKYQKIFPGKQKLSYMEASILFSFSSFLLQKLRINFNEASHLRTTASPQKNTLFLSKLFKSLPLHPSLAICKTTHMPGSGLVIISEAADM